MCCEGETLRPVWCAQSLHRMFLASFVLLVSFFWLGVGASYASASVQGDIIINSAQLTSNGAAIATSSVNVTVLIQTQPVIQFLTYNNNGTPTNVAPGAFRLSSASSAPFVSLPPPTLVGSTTPIDLTKPVPLLPTTTFHQGDPVFIQVTNMDQVLDRTKLGTVFVTVTDSSTGDTEVVLLTETGLNTGIFVGYIPSTGYGSVTPYNGVISITSGSNLQASYTDILFPSSTVTTTAMVDPFGIVFNSSTGAPVDGVKVTLINAATGNPATVYGDDGVSIFPSTVTTGSTPTDSSGRVYDFPHGGFRFPVIPPGQYQFQIVPPAGFSAPSTVPDATLQTLPGGPFALVNPGSRLTQFTVVSGSVIRIDIPIDPASSALWLNKTAGSDTVAVGDFLFYELDLQNTSKAGAASGVTITDTMPLGFRFRRGSARINGVVAPDPAISADGRTLVFAVGALAPQTTVSVRYVVEVAAGASVGIATNTATAAGLGGVTSNLAKATVQVKSDFLSSRSVLMGEVVNGSCGAPDAKDVKGMEGVRIFLEDGTFVDTDKRGMFHFEGITQGSHVVQLDLDSLPKGYEVVPCEENTRFAGTSYSQFVDLQGGSMWRVDFHVARQAKLKKARPEPSAEKGEVSLELTSALYGDTIVYQVPLRSHNVPNSHLQLSVTLPERVTYETNSSQLDGKPIADPAIAGTVLTYPLGHPPR